MLLITIDCQNLRELVSSQTDVPRAAASIAGLGCFVDELSWPDLDSQFFRINGAMIVDNRLIGIWAAYMLWLSRLLTEPDQRHNHSNLTTWHRFRHQRSRNP